MTSDFNERIIIPMRIFYQVLAMSLVVVILYWGASSIAVPTHSHASMNPAFASVTQPLGLKIAVTLGGIGLIGAELAWFLGNKSHSSPAIPFQNREK